MQYLKEDQGPEKDTLCSIMLHWYITKAETVTEKGEMMAPNNKETQAIGQEEMQGSSKYSVFERESKLKD